VRLGDDGQVGALGQQRGQELVDVAAHPAPVRRDGGGVDDYAGCVGQDGS
jgi:hypothetical protein